MHTVMNTTAIRQKLYDYIRVAEDKKAKAIYTMVEEEINDAYDWSSDPAFIAELDRRSAEYKSGKVKGVPWEEVKKQVQGSAKKGVRK
jgi:putative addiction module component (TIGR02574 family)